MQTIQSVDGEGFLFIGIVARTTNAREMSGKGVIGAMWQRAMTNGVIDQIPNRADASIIALYTDYKSDSNDEYTFLIGAKVTSIDSIPDEMVPVHIPEAHYAIFTSQRGPVWKVVPEVWQKIWSTPASEVGGERTFLADFEIYDEQSADPQNAQIQIWVGIK